jgi:hypothetical protein
MWRRHTNLQLRFAFSSCARRSYRRSGVTTGKGDRSGFVMGQFPASTLGANGDGNRPLYFLPHWYFYQFFRLEVLAMLLPTWAGKVGAKKNKIKSV